MIDASTLAQALPHPLPTCPNAHLALFAIRRLGAHGLADAQAANALLAGFGEGFRRPLVLFRTLMAELADASMMPIAIAPCCFRRMTGAEQALLTTLARAESQPGHAGLILADLLGVRRADAVLASVAAVAAAFADAGRPITH